MKWIVEFYCEFFGKWMHYGVFRSEETARYRANMQEALYGVETRVTTA